MIMTLMKSTSQLGSQFLLQPADDPLTDLGRILIRQGAIRRLVGQQYARLFFPSPICGLRKISNKRIFVTSFPPVCRINCLDVPAGEDLIHHNGNILQVSAETPGPEQSGSICGCIRKAL